MYVARITCTFLSEPEVGVVSAQVQPELGSARKHPVGFAGAVRRQVVDQHAQVGVGAVDRQRSATLDAQRRVDAGENTLASS